MGFSFKGFTYQILIDPILSRLYGDVAVNIEPSNSVIDVACGTGSISLALSQIALSVTGIDLSPEMITTAKRSAGKKRIKNVQFELRDATSLENYKDNEFDAAITSMSIHQFDYQLAINILREMKRISSKVIIIDYNWPMPAGLSSSIAFSIERFAGGDHYRNFRIYMEREGIHYFTGQAGLNVRSEVVRGNGIFIVVLCD